MVMAMWCVIEITPHECDEIQEVIIHGPFLFQERAEEFISKQENPSQFQATVMIPDPDANKIHAI